MHHIQKKIIYALTRKETARFAELRPKNLDSNIFTYHLKQLIAAKLIAKTASGNYKLTQNGKLTGINIKLDAKDELAQAHSVVFLAAQNASGEWLLRERLVHPAYGKVGFLHCEPNANESVIDTAEKSFKERISLLESFTAFTMLYAKNVSGAPKSPGDSGKNFWHSGDLKDPDLFPNMSELLNLLQDSDSLFFTEIHHEI
jgi:hypothetical protein